MQISKIYKLIFPVLCSITITAAGQSFEWAKHVGGPQWDEGRKIAVGSDGNIYVAGIFPGTADFDPGTAVLNFTAGGGQDIFITKYDPAGNFIWAKQIGGTGWEDCYGLALDDNDNIYITGSFLGVADFDPGPATFNLTASGEIDAFICKLDSAGNFIWVKQWGGSLAIAAHAIAYKNGNIYTTGYFDGTAEFDPGPGICYLAAVGYSDIFISKFDTAGNFIWAQKMSGPVGEGGYAIAVDENNNVYSTGLFVGTVDFDPGPGIFNMSTAGAGDQQIYISKLNAAGNFIWAKPLGGETGYAIATDDKGNVYITGYYAWDNIYITKLDSSGNITWAKQIGAFISYSLVVDDNYNVYTTGQWFGTEDFDPGPGTINLTAIGSSDSYINKLDSLGNFVWVKQLGGTNEVLTRCMVLDEDNSIYTTGFFDQTADFNPGLGTFNLTAAGSYDVFIHKLGAEPDGVFENADLVFNVYPNPTEGNLIIENYTLQTVTLVLRNMTGQIIETKYINQVGKSEIQINGASGIYLLEISNENLQKTVYKVLKQ